MRPLPCGGVALPLMPQDITAENRIMMLSSGTAQQQPMGFSDEFTSPEPAPHWQFWREFDHSRFQAGDGRLVLTARGSSPADTPPLTYITGDHSYSIEVDVEREQGCEAGILLYYNQEHS